MTDQQSATSLLEDPVARELLSSTRVARLAYTWSDGTPRVVPIWFHWDGEVVSMGSPPRAPKLRVLEARPEVAITIDDESAWPYKALLIRGEASVETLDDLSPEYVASAHRYLGDEQGAAWVAGLRGAPMAMVSVRPKWVRILDFVTRFPSAVGLTRRVQSRLSWLSSMPAVRRSRSSSVRLRSSPPP